MSGKLLRLFILFLLALIHAAPASGQERSDVTKVPIEPQSKSVTIVSKPNPEGQKEGSGEPQITLTLRAIFRSDGTVTDVHFVKATPKDAAKGIVKEFKKRAIEAAKQIKFTPATKDGHPVSMFMELEYAFNLFDDDKPAVKTPDTESRKPKDEKPKV